jgi:hypothetical protein
LAYLDERGFTRVDFSTNGNLLTADKAEKLLAFKCLDFIKVSLNSSRREIMEDMNTGSSLDTVLSNIRTILDIRERRGGGPSIWVQLIKSRLNEDETHEEVYRAVGRSDFTILDKRMNNFSGLVERNEYTYPGEIFWDGQCVFADKATYIHWDGDLAGCCNDNTKEQIFGNARDGIFSPAVQAKKEEFKRALRNCDFTNLPVCKKCVV